MAIRIEIYIYISITKIDKNLNVDGGVDHKIMITVAFVIYYTFLAPINGSMGYKPFAYCRIISITIHIWGIHSVTIMQIIRCNIYCSLTRQNYFGRHGKLKVYGKQWLIYLIQYTLCVIFDSLCMLYDAKQWCVLRISEIRRGMQLYSWLITRKTAGTLR